MFLELFIGCSVTNMLRYTDYIKNSTEIVKNIDELKLEPESSKTGIFNLEGKKTMSIGSNMQGAVPISKDDIVFTSLCETFGFNPSEVEMEYV